MVSHSKKVYKPRQDAFYVFHNLTSVYHHFHSYPTLQPRSAPSTRHPLFRLQRFDIQHLRVGFARYGPRRAAQGNEAKLLIRLTGSWLTSLDNNYHGSSFLFLCMLNVVWRWRGGEGVVLK